MSLKVKYWGVRGSLPSSASPEQRVKEIASLMQSFFKAGYKDASQISEFLNKRPLPTVGGYGTHTTCAEVNSAKTQLIIDAGSGLKNLGDSMMRGPAGKGQAEIHIFLTHFHWDHIIGLPFFVPNFIKGNVINFYAVQPELEKIVKTKFSKPLFPVSFEMLSSTIKFHKLEPRKPRQINDMTITPYMLDHPDPCWGLKVESGGKAYAHCVDTEGTRVSREDLGPDLPLYQGIDLMYFDAQYTLPELAEKANWGHSAAQLGLDIAFREKIKKVIFAHHDPGASTQNIQELYDQTREYYDWKKNKVDSGTSVQWRYAHEGLVVDLDQE